RLQPDPNHPEAKQPPWNSTFELVEVDRSGTPICRHRAPWLASAARRRYGNTLVGATFFIDSPALLEWQPTGRGTWQDFSIGHVSRVRVCLPLVSLGFDRPPALFDPDSVANRVQQLKDKDPKDRYRSLQFLEELGPRAEPAIPILIDSFDDPDKRVRAN